MLKSLIQSGKVDKIEQYFKSLVNHYTLGEHSFSPFGMSPPSALPASDPRKSYTETGMPKLTSVGFTMQSLVMIACHHPHQTPAVIKYLCCNFPKLIFIDQLEWCYHNLHSWSCVAPLHVACTGYNQNLKLVRTLVKLGADVNLKSGCCEVTPLHLSVASYGDKQAVDIARFLIDHGAIVDAIDRNGDTPLTLMFRCYGGSQIHEVTELLISKKANVNHSNNVGCTALHYAANNNDVDAITSLLLCGASPLFELSDNPSSSLPCPLYLVAYEEVANIFTSRSDCPITCKIDSLLLLGTSKPIGYTAVGSEDDVSRYELWRKAVALREEHSLMPNGESSINGMKEIRSISDLDECFKKSTVHIFDSTFTFNRRSEKMEKLVKQCWLIKERCLRYYCDLGDLLEIAATIKDYDNDEVISMKCLKLITHCFRNSLLPHWSLGIEGYWQSTLSTLNEILNVLVPRISHNFSLKKVTLTQVQAYAELFIGILEGLIRCYNTMLCTKTLKMHFETKNVIWSLLSVLVKWLSWLGTSGLASNDSSLLSLKLVVQDLVDKNLYLMNTTLLHLIPEYFSFKSSEDTIQLYELIIKSDGAESAVNFVSSEGNRPLHCVAKNASEPQHLMLISSLCDCGAHYDAVDMEGKTVIDYVIEADLKSQLEQYFPPSPLPLSCLSSQIIVKGNIPYQLDSVPPSIRKYISIHDPKYCVFSAPTKVV